MKNIRIQIRDQVRNTVSDMVQESVSLPALDILRMDMQEPIRGDVWITLVRSIWGKIVDNRSYKWRND